MTYEEFDQLVTAFEAAKATVHRTYDAYKVAERLADSDDCIHLPYHERHALFAAEERAYWEAEEAATGASKRMEFALAQMQAEARRPLS